VADVADLQGQLQTMHARLIFSQYTLRLLIGLNNDKPKTATEHRAPKT